MSCLHKRPKRTKSEEVAFQEQVKKVAQENGKRIGESPQGANVPELTGQNDALIILPTRAGAHNVYITWILEDLNPVDISH